MDLTDKVRTNHYLRHGTLSGFDSVSSSQQVLTNSKRSELVGVSGRKLCCIRVLEMQRSFQKFSFVPVQKQNDLLETQKSRVLGLLKNLYGCVKIRKFLPENQTIYWKQSKNNKMYIR